MTKARDLANAADVLDDVSATELSYVNGVTSAIQTQLNAKQAVVSGVNDTEIGYLDGVTSAIQTQIDSKIGSASAISPTLIDAKGDLIVGSAADTAARLAVGANDYVLTADSSATNGVKWAAVAGGSGGMTLISETVASSLSSLSFTSLGSHKQLLLIWSGVFTSGNGGFGVRFNNDSASNYSGQILGAVNSGIVNDFRNSDALGNGYDFIGQSVTSANLYDRSRGWLLVDNYTSSTKTKTWYGAFQYKDSQYNETKNHTTSGTYNSTSAITSLDIYLRTGSITFSNATNTTIRLYGIS